jgi:nicotinamide-nucleotide amidase
MDIGHWSFLPVILSAGRPRTNAILITSALTGLMLTAEILSIGDELTSGQRLDTNSQWLSQRLGEIGVRVLYHTTVADDLDANIRVFRQAIERADVVIATGGLGPTADDLTRDALAAVTGKPLVLHEESLRHIQQLFAQRGREMPPRNVVQATFPEDSRPIFNPHGTAPGIDMPIARKVGDSEPDSGAQCRFFALPGVPAEMIEMWPAVRDAILHLSPSQHVIRHRRIQCFGVGESDLERRLPDLIRRGREPSVGITVSGATITLRITAAGPTPEACEALMAPTLATIYECLGPLVFGEEEDELHHAVARLLAKRAQSLAVVEWGTAGLITHWLGETMTSPAFIAGIVVSDPASAARLLHVQPQSLASLPSCSTAMAEALAAAGRDLLQADYTLAVSDFPHASATGDEDRFHIALATASDIVMQAPRFSIHPSIVTILAAKRALDLLRLTLLK